MGNTVKKVMEAGGILNVLMVLGFLGIVWLMIYGNMSGNLGFAAGTDGYTNTQAVITNMTTGAKTFFNFAPTFFTITAIVLLITILLGLLSIAVYIYKSYSGKGSGFSE